MNRKEIIKELKNYIYQSIRDNLFDSDMGFGDKSHYHELFKSVLELLEKPVTLADLLGWEEGQEYEYRTGAILMLDNEKIYYKSDGCSSRWCNYNFFGNEIEDLRQAKKVEPKLKAYFAVDEYSFSCLIKELEEQGYDVTYAKQYRAGEDVIYIEKDKMVTGSHLSYHKEYEKDNYELIEYHKEEPKFYAKIKGWELLRSKEYKGSDCGGKWFIYAPSVGEITTIPEYAGINDTWIASMTKTEWNKLGINSTNADFERAG